MSRSPLPLGAGLAASLLWLAASFPASAQGTIRYVPNVNLTFPDGSTLWDPNQDGVTDYVFRFDGRSLGVFPQAGSRILAYPPTPPDLGTDVVPLALPSEIGNFDYSPIVWLGIDGVLGFPGRSYFNSCSGGACVGTFVGIRAHFGFSFQVEGATHYGWAAFHSYSTTLPGGVLEEYAYNLTPGAPIFVGQVPEPSAWSLLALSLGLLGGHRWRRARKV